MIPTEIDRRRETIKYMIEFCQSQLENLSHWEQNFIESVSEQFDEKGNLTDTQCDKLEQIYDKL